MGRTSKILIEIVLGLLVLTALLLGLAIWRVSSGPVSLNFLTPLIERALTEADSDVTIDIDDTVLVWGGWERNFDLRLRGVSVLARDGRRVAQLPEIAVGFSPKALARWMLAPERIELSGLHLNLVRDEEGRLQVLPDQQAGESRAVVPDFLADLLAPPNPDKPMGYLTRVSIRGADVTIDDRVLKRQWRAPMVDLTLMRDQLGLGLQLAAEVELAGQRQRATASGFYRAATGTVDLNADVRNLAPAALADIAPGFAPLAAVQVPVSGTLNLNLDAKLAPTTIAFRLLGGSGQIAARDMWPDGLPIRGLEVRGRLVDGLRRLELDAARVDLGGPSVELSGVVEELDAAPRVTAKAALLNVPVDDIRKVWPQGVGANPRRWITANLSAGKLDEVRVEAVLRAPQAGSTDLVPERLQGSLRFTGVSVNYLTPMPKVQDVVGTATFTHKEMNLAITGGGIRNLKVADCKIAITGFEDPDQIAAIAIDIRGPVREAMELIDGPPLNYVKAIKQAPSDFGGNARVRLDLKFPLIDRLKIEQLDIRAVVDIENFSQRDAALGRDITEGQMNLRVDQKALEAKGRVRLAGAPLEVTLSQNFLPNAPFATRVAAKGRLESADRAALGFDLKPYVDGATDVDITFTQRRSGEGAIIVNAQLDRAKLTLEELDWSKPAGTPGTAKAEVTMAGQRPTGVRALTLAAGDLRLDGRVGLAEDGKSWTRIDIDRFNLGRNDLKGGVARRGAGFAIEVSGRSANLEQLMRDSGRSDGERPPLAISASLDRVYFAADRYVDRVVFRGDRLGTKWRNVDLKATTDGGGQVEVALTTARGGRQTLSGGASDAGALLKAFDVTPNMVGGKLTLSGATDETRQGRPLAGKLEMTEFKLVNAPMLARVLSLASLTGIVRALSGQTGLAFRSLIMEFAFFDPLLEIREGRAFGGELGLTARGTIDIDSETADLEGTIVPAYTINSLLGNIPIIGNIFVGERGGGMFAATYSIRGPLQDPSISVNPLATLAPGFVRNLFGILGSGTSPEGTEPRPEPAPAQPSQAQPPRAPPPRAPVQTQPVEPPIIR